MCEDLDACPSHEENPQADYQQPSYCWLINQNHLDHKAVMVVGPHDSPLTPEEILRVVERHHFKMYDGDGELYFSGYLVGDASSEDGFAPLDDYGRAFGCVEIRYRQPDGTYEIL